MAALPAPCLHLLSLFIHHLGKLLPAEAESLWGPERESIPRSADGVCFYGLWVLNGNPR